MKIGYIGLGAMGSSLARQLLGKYELAVWDLNPAAIDNLVKDGAIGAASTLDITRDCDAIIYCLPRSQDVHESLFGEYGIANALRPGQLVIDQTSGVPSQTAAMAKMLRTKGVLMIDAPISGGVPLARQGRATIMCSGPDDAWRVAEPIVRDISTKVFRCSENVGDGQTMKLLNNALGSGYRTATLELAIAGRKLGLSLTDITARLQTGYGRNVTARTMLPARLEGRSYTDFALSLMVKDMSESIALAQAATVPMLITTACRSLLITGMNSIGPDARLEQIIDIVETMAGIKLDSLPETHLTHEAANGLLSALEDALAICDQLCVYECVALGLKCGLPLAAQRDILNSGSAWSAASEDILTALADGRDPSSHLTLGQARDALRAIINPASRIYVPLFIPNIVLAEVEAAISEYGESTNAAKLGVIVNRRASVWFSRDEAEKEV